MCAPPVMAVALLLMFVFLLWCLCVQATWAFRRVGIGAGLLAYVVPGFPALHCVRTARCALGAVPFHSRVPVRVLRTAPFVFYYTYMACTTLGHVCFCTRLSVPPWLGPHSRSLFSPPQCAHTLLVWV